MALNSPRLNSCNVDVPVQQKARIPDPVATISFRDKLVEARNRWVWDFELLLSAASTARQ